MLKLLQGHTVVKVEQCQRFVWLTLDNGLKVKMNAPNEWHCPWCHGFDVQKQTSGHIECDCSSGRWENAEAYQEDVTNG